jgi:hypothetical protein
MSLAEIQMSAYLLVVAQAVQNCRIAHERIRSLTSTHALHSRCAAVRPIDNAIDAWTWPVQHALWRHVTDVMRGLEAR